MYSFSSNSWMRPVGWGGVVSGMGMGLAGLLPFIRCQLSVVVNFSFSCNTIQYNTIHWESDRSRLLGAFISHISPWSQPFRGIFSRLLSTIQSEEIHDHTLHVESQTRSLWTGSRFFLGKKIAKGKAFPSPQFPARPKACSQATDARRFELLPTIAVGNNGGSLRGRFIWW